MQGVHTINDLAWHSVLLSETSPVPRPCIGLGLGGALWKRKTQSFYYGSKNWPTTGIVIYSPHPSEPSCCLQWALGTWDPCMGPLLSRAGWTPGIDRQRYIQWSTTYTFVSVPMLIYPAFMSLAAGGISMGTRLQICPIPAFAASIMKSTNNGVVSMHYILLGNMYTSGGWSWSCGRYVIQEAGNLAWFRDQRRPYKAWTMFKLNSAFPWTLA